MPRGSRGIRIAEQSELYQSIGQGSLPDEASMKAIQSTQEETRRAVERNAIDRGSIFVSIILELRIDALLAEIQRLADTADHEEFYERAEHLGLSTAALRLLDDADPPIPYVCYFCLPEFLIARPQLAFYYRNIAMLSDKVMRGIGLNTGGMEAGSPPTPQRATDVAAYLNRVVSGLLMKTGVSPQRHLEMLFANLGDSLGGSSRNEVGRVAYAQVLRPLVLDLWKHDSLDSILYCTRCGLAPGIERDDDAVLSVAQTVDVAAWLDEVEAQHIKYKEIHLKNGVTLLLDKSIRWYDKAGQDYTPSIDLHSSSGNDSLGIIATWGAEVKGGADPAGSDEHWKTARSALSRVLDDAEKSGHPKPPLSFIGVTIVETVAYEIVQWQREGKLVSAYNLTKMLESQAARDRFLEDMRGFLGYGSNVHEAD
jgi:hypothetical protein